MRTVTDTSRGQYERSCSTKGWGISAPVERPSACQMDCACHGLSSGRMWSWRYPETRLHSWLEFRALFCSLRTPPPPRSKGRVRTVTVAVWLDSSTDVTAARLVLCVKGWRVGMCALVLQNNVSAKDFVVSYRLCTVSAIWAVAGALVFRFPFRNSIGDTERRTCVVSLVIGRSWGHCSASTLANLSEVVCGLPGVVPRVRTRRYSLYFFLRGEGPRSRCYGRTAALRLFVQPVMKMNRKISFFIFPSSWAPVEWNWQGKTDNSEKSLSQCHFVHHKPHMDWSGNEPGSPQWKAGD
jgi:hypothetical protein